MDRSTTVLIADDHPIFRKGLRQVITSDESIRVVDEASDGTEALRLIREHSPDIAILDISMPSQSGLDVVRTLRSQGVTTLIIFLTMYDEEEMFDEAMDLEVRGYVLKDDAVRDILACIKAVAAGRHYVSSSVSNYLVHRRMSGDALRKQVPGLQLLTPTERRIVGLIAEGRTSKDIAGALNISPKTVDNHRLNISTKLGLRGTHALLKFAVKHKKEL